MKQAVTPPAPPPDSITRYGLIWPKGTSDIAIERHMIQNGGAWKSPKGAPVGEGLFFHYRRLQSLLWPEDDHHEWSDLQLKSYVEERFTTVMGPKDCGKTRGLAKYALCDFFCFPEDTMILVTSTTLQGMQLRVWGDMKTLFVRAKEQWPEAPGFPLESKYGIFTDELDENVGIRDMRKGIICVAMRDSQGQWVGLASFTGIKQKRRRLLGDECFPAGSLVHTARGLRPIEYVRAGDWVLNAAGYWRVLETRSRQAKELIRIHFKDGRTLTCTPEHPLLTNEGWKKACEVGEKQFILGPHETLQILREPDYQRQHHLLFEGLSSELAVQYARGSSLASDPGATPQSQREGATPDAYRQSDEGPRAPCATQRDSESDGAQAGDSWGQRHGTDPQGAGTPDDVPRGLFEPRDQDGSVEWQRVSPFLQSRFGVARYPTRRGSGRANPQLSGAPGARREEDRLPTGAWVDRVEVYQQTGGCRAGRCRSGHIVYNLQVEGHPSYVVNGFVVHNCQFYRDSYLSVLANLDKGDFKGCFVGNPIGDNDPLDKLAEPDDGWDSIGDITSTTTWRNKWGGQTINLVGSDSPAIKSPGKFTYLTNQLDIDRIARRFGKDSFEYWNQAMGVRKPGAQRFSVFTRDMAVQFGCLDDVVWLNDKRTRGYALDAAYGGDRCVGIPFEFGQALDGSPVLAFSEPEIIPVVAYRKDVPVTDRLSPEDQIAAHVMARCMTLGVPPENVFFDATGRGSLGTAFARRWSARVNPMEFGGKPTNRPVCNDLYTYDEKFRRRRLKLANEHYDRLVTELHFSLRYAGESRQLRRLPEAVLDELTKRKWMPVKGDRYSLEIKDDYKERYGVSPDNSDAAVIAVEGARRLGFHFARLEDQAPEIERDRSWMADIRARAARLRSAHSLNYTA